jgi:hypothetical protein
MKYSERCQHTRMTTSPAADRRLESWRTALYSSPLARAAQAQTTSKECERLAVVYPWLGARRREGAPPTPPPYVNARLPRG